MGTLLDEHGRYLKAATEREKCFSTFSEHVEVLSY